ncbi:four-carbon acid sugar kinase family protein [Clostridium rectalis]|uniref:four-carbon acid sugar kinase family protein n=1 Tax=Clostridium rectalis TaxID=2040295 RepID=UPI000F641903|nr:four-carbon acid sugar kinase family protein [Clostridium rectalis]
MGRYLIIADDFTGANDTGVQLKKRGITTEVIFNIDKMRNPNNSYVIDTESRGLTEHEAYDKVKDSIKNLNSYEFQFIYKKVDSTLRGNISAEVKAIDEEYEPDIIIFSPAFPEIGRTTLNGIHRLNGIRIIETELSKDPKKPVIEDNISNLIKKFFSEKVIHYNISDIREEKMNFNNGRIYSFDVENSDDMIRIVSNVLVTGKKTLWVGSAGMADTILKIKNPLKPSIAVVGSISDVSIKQLRYAENSGINILKLPIDKVLIGEKEDYYIDYAVNLLSKDKDLIITSTYDRNDYEKAIIVGKDMKMTSEEVSQYTESILGNILDKIMEKSEVSGVFLTGGDTAISFINKTGSICSNIIEEIMPGIPLMKLKGGKYHGLKIITKAGAFGEKNAISYCMKKIKEDL